MAAKWRERADKAMSRIMDAGDDPAFEMIPERWVRPASDYDEEE